MKDNNNTSDQTEPPCKRRTEDDSTKSYPLTLNEWRYCYNILDKSSPEEIVNKAHLLPMRFHNLLEDIVALQSSESIGSQIDWETIWKELTTLQRRPTANKINDTGLPYGPNQDVNNQRDFGLELGRIMRFLCESGDGSKQVVMKGFIRGLMIDESKRIDPEDVKYNVIREGKIKMLDSVGDTVHPDNKEVLEDLSSVLSEIERELHSQVFKSLQEMDYRSKSMQAIQFPTLCIDAALESVNITPTTFAQNFVENRMEFDYGIIPRSEEKREKRLNQARKVAEKLKRKERISTAENLADLLSKDMETLRNEKGSKGWLIFREIAKNGGVVSKADLMDRTDLSKEETGYILAKISGKKEPDERWLRGQQWSDRPIISEVGNDNWKTTPLGDLIYNISYQTTTLDPDTELSREKITEQLHKHMLEDGHELPSADEWLNRLR